ncbi:Sec-independent protein translocase protein TatB [Natronohydrobacter thiooxidans]|uniref:Sec-independent protein translocase protein TatB n=1 Tax=Natronohydrobacter thiooxidans TaxID=87172 RepID=UPI0008FF2CD3|nr:Sec-independent protein translocase protein TatB [Natronohydrobacter thiooxidans]
MFDIGWTELLVIGIVALIVVGPKDLPKMFRTLGQMTAKMRGMAREFQRAMDEAADASGMKDVARDLRKATDAQGMGLDELNKMRNWDPLKDGAAGKSGKPASGAKDASGDADEEAMDRIAAEMDNLRRERAVKPAAPGTEAATTPARPDAGTRAKAAAKPANAKPAKAKTAAAKPAKAGTGSATPDAAPAAPKSPAPTDKGQA